MEILHTERRRWYEGGAERFAKAGLEDLRDGGATSQEMLVASWSGQDKGSILP